MTQDSFRNAMRRVAATVSVLSTQRDDRRFGITVSSVASLTMEPPTLCFGIHQASSFCEPLIETGWVCVNVLSREQEAVGRMFASAPAGEHRFRTGQWSEHEIEGQSSADAPPRLPRLLDAQANFACRLQRTIPHGTHLLCLAEVRHVAICERIEPLLYCDGAYHKLATGSREPASLRTCPIAQPRDP